MLLSECMVVCLNEKVFIFSGFFESILYDNKESKEMFTYHIIIMTELEFLEKIFFFRNIYNNMIFTTKFSRIRYIA